MKAAAVHPARALTSAQRNLIRAGFSIVFTKLGVARTR